jgi:(1->4)-alpha-D-glucan 1-alpha-D-glucosylmutase
MSLRAKEWPHGMTATATHDTKRGEDARARLLALAELPGEWASSVGRWKILNAPHLVVEASMRSPSAAFEYMLYQALVGAWPLAGRDEPFLERMQAYALKAAREGKQETSWLNPHQAYEAGLRTFLERILDRTRSAEFLDSLRSLTQRTSLLGALNSLSQITLKATMPGVPDFYQGTEFWDFSLVDPDNRRPVDFAARASALASVETPDWTSLAQNWTDGRIKLAWTRHLLKLRAEFADLFASGDYQPLQVIGPHRDHVIAFARRHGGDAVIIAVGKSLAPLTQGGRAWPDANVYDGAIVTKGYSLAGISGNELPLADAFEHLPAAVLKAKVAGRRRGKNPEPN